MNRARLLRQLQQHPKDPQLIEAMINHELGKAEKFQDAGDTLRANVHLGRAETWDLRKTALTQA